MAKENVVKFFEKLAEDAALAEKLNSLDKAFADKNDASADDAAIREKAAGAVVLPLAEEAGLPKIIKDLIAQHHGKGITRYFYFKAREANPDHEVDPAPYTYPGPNPQTKEAAILMMADACEAATKSMADHSEEAIAAMVSKIIDGQVADGLLRETPISFRDVETVKKLFVERLRTSYHMRVSYPSDVKATTPGEEKTDTRPPHASAAPSDESK